MTANAGELIEPGGAAGTGTCGPLAVRSIRTRAAARPRQCNANCRPDELLKQQARNILATYQSRLFPLAVSKSTGFPAVSGGLGLK